MDNCENGVVINNICYVNNWNTLHDKFKNSSINNVYELKKNNNNYYFLDFILFLNFLIILDICFILFFRKILKKHLL